MFAYKYLQQVSNITCNTTTQWEFVHTDAVLDIPFLAFLFDLDFGSTFRDEPPLVETLVTLSVITLVTL